MLSCAALALVALVVLALRLLVLDVLCSAACAADRVTGGMP